MEIPRLHPDTIEAVKQQVDIVDIISEHVVLRKRGKDYLGLCPFHQEKTPSFSVSPSKQLYYCFGCGAGGNAFKFLMELGKQSFYEVVLDLARVYQVPLKTLEPQQRQELQRQLTLQEQLYEILALTASFYQHALRQPQAEAALNYVKNERQLREETIGQFGLGYAPAGWETLYRYLIEQKRYPVSLVEQAGLIKKRKSGEGFYDRFRDRLMIPIADYQGRIIGFGSRTLPSQHSEDGTQKEPKYLNSPETPLFDKSKTLFALDQAKASIAQQDRAVVVEGYFDAIALHSVGITNAVASLGTALTQNQIKQLLRYTDSKQIVFNFDADNAGVKATQRAIKEIEPLIYSGQVQLRVLNLPDGKDADDFLKSAPDAPAQYYQLIESAPLWLDWQIGQLLSHQDLKQADQFQQVAQNMVKLLSKIENQATKDRYIAYCAQLLSQGKSEYFKINTQDFKLLTEELYNQVKRQQRPTRSNRRPVQLSAPQDSRLEEAEADLLRIYLHYPEHRQEIMQALEAKDLLFSLSHHRFLWQQILELDKAEDRVNQLLNLLQDRSNTFPEQMAQVAHLFYLPERILQTENQAEKIKVEKTEKIIWEDPLRIPLIIRSAIASLERVACEKYHRYCLQQWQTLDHSTEAERMQYYWQESQNAKLRLEELNKLCSFTQADLLNS